MTCPEHLNKKRLIQIRINILLVTSTFHPVLFFGPTFSSLRSLGFERFTEAVCECDVCLP